MTSKTNLVFVPMHELCAVVAGYKVPELGLSVDYGTLQEAAIDHLYRSYPKDACAMRPEDSLDRTYCMNQKRQIIAEATGTRYFVSGDEARLDYSKR